MPCTSLPVLMYHYVSRFSGPINVSPETFEAQCRGMAEAGWRGVGLAEAEAWLRGEGTLPRRSVLITFDDGFLDNYVHAWPILEKYGHQGVVFAVTGRIETDTALRPTLGDVWKGRAGIDDLPPVDTPLARHALGYDSRNDLFFNWAEARAMESSGVIAVAGHTVGHLRTFTDRVFPPRAGNTEADSAADAARRFHTPGRHGNTFYRLEGEVPWGLPRFTEQPAMCGPAFRPSAELLAAIRNLVPQDKAGAFAFFQNPDKVRALHALVDGFTPDRLGDQESAQAARSRIRNELEQCARTLTGELGHGVASLCWPWGKYADMAREEARQAGFSIFYSTRPGANTRGNSQDVKRFKVRDKSWPWLRLRLEVYSRPLPATVYARLKG